MPEKRHPLNIPFGVSFPKAFAQWLKSTFTCDDRLRTIVLMPTKRSIASVVKQFDAGKKAQILPQFVALSDVNPCYPIYLDFPLKEVISRLEKFEFVRQHVKKFFGGLSAGQEKNITHHAMQLLDEWGTHAITSDTLKSALTTAPGAQEKADFLCTLAKEWEIFLGHRVDPLRLQREQLLGLAKAITKRSQDHNFVLAGSTGSRTETRALAQAIFDHPNGFIITYGASNSSDTQPNVTDPTYWLTQLRHQLKSAFKNIPASTHSLTPAFLELKTPQEEAALITLICQYHLSQDPHTDILIVCPTTQLQKEIDYALQAQGIKPNTSLSKPLSKTEVGGFLISLCRLKDSFSEAHFLSLLKHPCFTLQDRQAHLEKVYGYETALRQKKKVVFECPALKAFLAAPLTFDVLWKTACALNPTLVNNEIALQIVTAISDAHLHTQALNTLRFIEWLEQLPSATSTATPNCTISLVGVLEARLLSPDVIILCDLNEASWPSPIIESPWITPTLRRQLNLPALETFVSLSAHDFYSCMSCNNIYVTRARQKNQQEILPSPFWQQLKSNVKAATVDHWYEWLNANLQTKALHIQPPAPSPKEINKPLSITVSDMDLLLKDPYGYYAKRLLKLIPLQPLTEDPTVQDRGIFLHKVMEAFVKQRITTVDDALVCLKKLLKNEKFFDVFWVKTFEKIAMWWGQNAQLNDSTTYLTEHPGACTLSAGTATITLQARADRLDITQEGTVTLIDYKTGTPPTQKQIEGGMAPQLLLEALIAQDGGFQVDPVNQLMLEIWQLKGRDTYVNILSFTPTDNMLKACRTACTQLIAYFWGEGATYLSCPVPHNKPAFPLYTTLARTAEWEGLEEN